jgi:hypothetical protein
MTLSFPDLLFDHPPYHMFSYMPYYMLARRRVYRVDTWDREDHCLFPAFPTLPTSIMIWFLILLVPTSVTRAFGVGCHSDSLSPFF